MANGVCRSILLLLPIAEPYGSAGLVITGCWRLITIKLVLAIKQLLNKH
jgi:hypothetical protein